MFESGLGDGASVWRNTIERLGNALPIFAYDRPGYGGSPANSTSRDPCTIAIELHARLKAAGRAPPYIMVGHSLGGQYAYAFARLFPAEMAGLVLVDATAVGHWQELEEKMPAATGMVKVLKATTFSSAMRHEFDAQDQCLDSLPRKPMAFPVRVLVRTEGNGLGGEQLLRIERDMASTWLAMTGSSRIEPVDGAGHYIQRDRPAALAAVILEVAKR